MYSYNNNYEQFRSWLTSQGKMKWTIKESVNYAKRFASVLDTGDASPLMLLSPRNKQHAMTALANYAKFTGRYDQFLQLKKRYNLKWFKVDATQHFQRFFDEGLTLDVMLQRIREMIRLLPENMSKIIKYGCLVGLRASEAVESVRLLRNPQTFAKYYNPERQALEHFRFPSIFLRQTKKAYISFVTPSMVEEITKKNVRTYKIGSKVPTHNAITLACRTKGIPMEMHLTRKIFASWLRKKGIQPEVVDMLQGRVSQSILTRHYLVPQDGLKEQVLDALKELQKLL